MLDVSKLPEGPALKAWREELEARGELRGKLEGKLEASRLTLTTLLEKRGFMLSDEQRAQIANESNLAVLMRWFDRAITATSVEEALSAAPANAE